MTDRKPLPTEIDRTSFSSARKGYDKKEVKRYLADLETSFRDLESWAFQTKERLTAAEQELSAMRATEEESVDKAMYAVFDAKDRIIEGARTKAGQIEAEAEERAAAMMAEAERVLETARADAEALHAGAPGARAPMSPLPSEQLAEARREAEEIVEGARRRATEIEQQAEHVATSSATAAALERIAVLEGERNQARSEAEQHLAELGRVQNHLRAV